jgi:hypothetical protein
MAAHDSFASSGPNWRITKQKLLICHLQWGGGRAYETSGLAILEIVTYDLLRIVSLTQCSVGYLCFIADGFTGLEPLGSQVG